MHTVLLRSDAEASTQCFERQSKRKLFGSKPEVSSYVCGQVLAIGSNDFGQCQVPEPQAFCKANSLLSFSQAGEVYVANRGLALPMVMQLAAGS